MRVGIAILPDQRWSVARERWQRAEAYGFDHAWTYDHLGWRDLVDSPWFDSMSTLTAAATVTTTMRLGTLVASPNFRHPAHFAREITALDDISAGRLTVGVGAGTADFDAAVLGARPLSPRERVDRYAEFVGLLDVLLSEQRATRSGAYYTVVDARSDPGCVQQPRVPFLLAANGPRSMRIAARYGQGWVTTGPRTDDLDAWWSGVADAAALFDAALFETAPFDAALVDAALVDAALVDAALVETALGLAGRGRQDVSRVLQLDSAPVFSMSSVDAFTDAVGRAADIGFTDVITHWPRENSWYAGSEAVLEAVASDVLPHLGKNAPRPG